MKTKLTICKEMKYDMPVAEDGTWYLTIRLDTGEEIQEACEKLMSEMGLVNKEDN